MSDSKRKDDTEQLTDDQPTVSLPREEANQIRQPEDPGLPTSDPVFPTASPPLKPPRPADVSGFGAPGGASPERVPADSIPKESGAPGVAAPGDSAPSPAASSPAAARPGYPVGRPVPPTPRPPRSAAEIRADIEAGRQELSQSVEVLRDKVNELTDWRGQIRKHRREITIAAAAVGFAVGARFMLRRRR